MQGYNPATERILFLAQLPGIGLFRCSPFRLIWRTIFVVIVTLIAALIPFFNDIVALMGESIPILVYVDGAVNSCGCQHVNIFNACCAGAIGFGPLTVFFPVRNRLNAAPLLARLIHQQQSLSRCQQSFWHAIGLTVGRYGQGVL